MLSDSLRQRLSEQLPGAVEPLDLVVRTDGVDTPLASAFADLAREVEALAGGAVRVSTEGPGELLGTPALTLGRGGRRNVHYLALPEGLEAEPFVEGLVGLAAAKVPAPFPGRPAAELIVFVSPACPHCAGTVSSALHVALEQPEVSVVVVDASRYEDLATRFQVRSVPLTLLDREWVHVGPLSASDLGERIRSRSGPDHGAAVLASMLDNGRLDAATERVGRPGGAVEFTQVWLRSSMSTRMGLVAVVEDLLAASPRALDAAAAALLPALDAEDAGLRGDTADVLGQIGNPAAISALEAHADDPDPDVVEAVSDALETLRG